ncbi:hypothetical protein EJB05_27627 [Eragrostis curvula]|uniref:DCD domain-containing protein n=1 Tax=Eragrostis curvula TaxID=38414 RepID=A0A5J9UNW1_9POAL|nr:hypothetical protein EJB05_27627 [Eragrostis curvula]
MDGDIGGDGFYEEAEEAPQDADAAPAAGLHDDDGALPAAGPHEEDAPAAAALQDSEDSDGPGSPSAIFIAAVRAAFAAAPEGEQPCIECMLALFEMGKNPAEAKTYRVASIRNHYQDKHRQIMRNKRKRSECSVCRNWFATVVDRKSHQKRFRHLTESSMVFSRLQASPGQISIDPYAWSKDGSFSTAFPAQVHIRMKTQYPNLLEAQFKRVLADNYYNHPHFYFELDHAQTTALISLFKTLAPANFNLAQAVSTKRSTVVSLSKASVGPEPQKVKMNPKGASNSFSMLSNASGAVSSRWTDLADSGADNASISKYSCSNTDDKGSGELVSDWYDLDDVSENQFGPHSNPDVASKKSSFKSVNQRMEHVECNHPAVNLVSGERGTFDESMLVNSHNEHTGAANVNVIENAVHNSPGGEGLTPEKLTVLNKLKELCFLRQQSTLPSQDCVDSTSDQCAPEETQVNANLCCDPFGATMEDKSSFQEWHGNADASELLQIITELTKRTEALEKKQAILLVVLIVAIINADSSAYMFISVGSLCYPINVPLFFQIGSDQHIHSLREVVENSGIKVQQLEYVVDELQFIFNSSLSHLGSMCNILAKPSIFLIGGYNGVTLLPSLDSLTPDKDVLVGLMPIGSARSYASAAVLDGHIFAFGGRDGMSWYHKVECYSLRNNEECPSLNRMKGSLAGISLNDKIYAISGGDGNETFSEVEVFDPYLGKWIRSPSVLSSRFALAAVEMSGVIYTAGGYDGSIYMETAERYDPREGLWVKLPSMNTWRGCHALTVLGEALHAMGGYDGESMVSSVEIDDPLPCLNSLRMGDPMHTLRGYAADVNLIDSLFLIGGMQSNVHILDIVEVTV